MLFALFALALFVTGFATVLLLGCKFDGIGVLVVLVFLTGLIKGLEGGVLISAELFDIVDGLVFTGSIECGSLMTGFLLTVIPLLFETGAVIIVI